MDMYICTTYYHVYVLLLKRLTGFQSPCDVVICDDLPTGEKIKSNLSAIGLFNTVWYITQSKFPVDNGYNRIDRILFQHKRRFKEINGMLPFDIKSYKNIFIFHDNTALGRFLNDGKVKYHLIEDSYNFFQRINLTPQHKYIRQVNYKYKLARFLNVGYFPLGASKYVADIEVNQNKALQIKHNHIVELSRDYMRSLLSEADKKLIFKVFGCPEFPKIGKNTAILLTEPLFRDGVCDEEQQISIYKYVTRDLQDKGYNVVIKPHPRDECNYLCLNAFITERFYPIEVIEDNSNTGIECVAAVSSSAIYSIHAKKIYLYTFLINGGQKDV